MSAKDTVATLFALCGLRTRLNGVGPALIAGSVVALPAHPDLVLSLFEHLPQLRRWSRCICGSRRHSQARCDNEQEYHETCHSIAVSRHGGVSHAEGMLIRGAAEQKATTGAAAIAPRLRGGGRACELRRVGAAGVAAVKFATHFTDELEQRDSFGVGLERVVRTDRGVAHVDPT